MHTHVVFRRIRIVWAWIMIYILIIKSRLQWIQTHLARSCYGHFEGSDAFDFRLVDFHNCLILNRIVFGGGGFSHSDCHCTVRTVQDSNFEQVEL